MLNKLNPTVIDKYVSGEWPDDTCAALYQVVKALKTELSKVTDYAQTPDHDKQVGAMVQPMYAAVLEHDVVISHIEVDADDAVLEQAVQTLYRLTTTVMCTVPEEQQGTIHELNIVAHAIGMAIVSGLIPGMVQRVKH